MSTELVIQLIILATALVGLYKAATFKPAESSSDGKTETSPVSEAVAGLLDFVGMFAFMLAMPAFIWAFTAITSNIGSSSTRNEVVQYTIPYEISKEPSQTELMLIAASQIPYDPSRGSALEKVSNFAIQKGDYKMAVLAASSIPYEPSRGTQLEKVIESIEKQAGEKLPNKKISND
ncbi:hypothetical protein [Shewanella glacialimarina]|uniref:hypothetical protein n=1 Tax=Shewanella glacialimarina TaxID=2590884 RepID=UPI001CF8E081|nr:hypothetical protein [Shewanella glacialimarina]UCX05014.1 hypothetical protein FJ709_11200 [Shewanella glacialimarina]